MTTITAPLTNITLQGLTPDVVRSCIVQQPSPPPDPGETPPPPVTAEGIYTPVAPGVTYEALPTVTIVDTSPAQMIGCIIDTADNPQGRLNALFPSAVNGDGVVERSTNDIWVFDGATWNNVGPTPGPTIVTTTVVPPWNEIVVYDARVRTRLEVNSLAYALELLTEPAAYGITLGMTVQTAQALVRVPYTDSSFAVLPPAVSSGGSVLPPAAATTLAAPVPQVSSGGSVAVPLTDIALEASMVPYVGPQATVVQASAANTAITSYAPQIYSGVAVEPPAAVTTLVGALPVIYSKPAPVLFTINTSTGNTIAYNITGVTADKDDVLLAIVETSGDGASVAPTPDGTIGGTFAAVTGSPVTDVATTNGSKLHAWWLRCSSTFTNRTVTIEDSGDHQLAYIYIIRGCTTSGDPWDVTATSTKTVASTTASAPAVTTAAANTYVLSVVSRPNDSSSVSAFGAPSNSILTSFTDLGEAGSTSGNGGGFVATAGTKRLPGSTGVTSFATAPNTTNAAITIAFKA